MKEHASIVGHEWRMGLKERNETGKEYLLQSLYDGEEIVTQGALVRSKREGETQQPPTLFGRPLYVSIG